MEPPTLDDLVKHANIPPTLLDLECCDEHLTSISLFLDWRRVASHLGLDTTDMIAILHGHYIIHALASKRNVV